MEQVKLPFDLHESHAHQGDLYNCGLFRTFPPVLQEACQQNLHLLKYLHMMPIEKIGIPQYYPKPSRKLADLKERNLLYPVSKDILIHVWSGLAAERETCISRWSRLWR